MSLITITAVLYGTGRKKTLSVRRDTSPRELTKLCSSKFGVIIKSITPDNTRYLLQEDMRYSDFLTIYCHKKEQTLVYKQYKKSKKPAVINNMAVLSMISDDAMRQVKTIAKYRNMHSIIVLPNMYPSPFSPNGGIYITKDAIYPSLLGSDIGAGVSLCATKIRVSDINKRMMKRLYSSLENLTDDIQPLIPPEQISWANNYLDYPDLSPLDMDLGVIRLGTIGCGDHGVEYHVIDDIIDNDVFSQLNLSDVIYVVINAGSRVIGSFIQREYNNDDRLTKKELSDYMILHNTAHNWAIFNRAMIARRLNIPIDRCVTDNPHTCIENIQNYYVHHKGSISSSNKYAFIHGDKGYFVQIINNDTYGISCSAGRRWTRTSSRYRHNDLRKQDKRYDDHVIYRNKDDISYKDIERVICDLVNTGAIRIICTTKAIIALR